MSARICCMSATYKPHKNVDGLLRAFAAGGLTADFDLLLTGTLSPGFIEGLRGLTDDGLLADLRVRGLHRARRFDWNEVAGGVMFALDDT